MIEPHPGIFAVAGDHSEDEAAVWASLEKHGTVEEDELERVFPSSEERETLARLVVRGLAFRSPRSGRVVALSRLAPLI